MTRYREFGPSDLLKQFVDRFFVCESDDDVIIHDQVFASGCIEVMFNLHPNGSQQITSGVLPLQPAVQLWGQTISPLNFTAYGKHAMFGIRFFPHTAAFFFDEPVSAFNDQLLDLYDVAGNKARSLHMQIADAPDTAQRILLAEAYLKQKISRSGKLLSKFKLVNAIKADLTEEGSFENINTVAARYGISTRYMQKLFVTYSGLSPALYCKIMRFQQSIELMATKQMSLTSIAYRCGYYDQSHFIKDLKHFTGVTPSHFNVNTSTDLFVPMNA